MEGHYIRAGISFEKVAVGHTNLAIIHKVLCFVRSSPAFLTATSACIIKKNRNWPLAGGSVEIYRMTHNTLL